ncbi:APC family permease [Nonomuraea sp. NPDC050556]|uniref:APC family permease n=1 Tax=Nonomuraea sp. NPDC050556 TaxID=3364369 RepID=UPI0037913AF5
MSDITTTEQVSVNRLKKNAVGLVGVIFMAVATAAPITAMTGNVPIVVGFGNGLGVPAAYLFATVVLTIFSVGYTAMAKHITAAGAFYGYISHGLGQIVGMVSGLLATMAYVVFEASIIGFFAYQGNATFKDLVGVDIHWMWFALVGLALNAILTYFDINLTAKVLGIFLVTEIFMLGLVSVVTLLHGGGPDGLMAGTLNPAGAFTVTGLKEGAVGLGLFMCFWSWVGFESTAMYGEESREPKKIIPIATLVSVVGIGLFYTFVSWMTVAANGMNAPEIAAAKGAEIFFAPTQEMLGSWAVGLFKILILTGSFACSMAFHNCASRYLYAMGREDLIPGTARTLGRTHAKHGSPHIAGFVQTGVSLLIIVLFAVMGQDPYFHIYTLLAVLGTLAILIVQTLCSFSVISYFHVKKKHPETANVWRTLIAPLAGGVMMAYVVLLLLQNQKAAAGDVAASSAFYTAIPWIVGGIIVLGVALALFLKVRNPAKYALIGRVVMEDTVERD